MINPLANFFQLLHHSKVHSRILLVFHLLRELRNIDKKVALKLAGLNHCLWLGYSGFAISNEKVSAVAHTVRISFPIPMSKHVVGFSSRDHYVILYEHFLGFAANGDTGCPKLVGSGSVVVIAEVVPYNVPVSITFSPKYHIAWTFVVVAVVVLNNAVQAVIVYGEGCTIIPSRGATFPTFVVLHNGCDAIPEPNSIGDGIHPGSGYLAILDQGIFTLPDPDAIPNNAVDSTPFNQYILLRQ